jgi:hypothetical protein
LNSWAIGAFSAPYPFLPMVVCDLVGETNCYWMLLSRGRPKVTCARPTKDVVTGHGGRVDLGGRLASSSDAFPYKSWGWHFRFGTLTCILAFLALLPPSLGFVALVPPPLPLPQLSLFHLHLPWIYGFAWIAPTRAWRAFSGMASFTRGPR